MRLSAMLQAPLVTLRSFAIAMLAAVVLTTPAHAQGDDSVFTKFNLERGPFLGQLGIVASVDVPEHCRFTEAKGTKDFLSATHNPPSGAEVGLLLCQSGVTDSSFWFVVFTFEQSGYVKDDEKGKLDPPRILKRMQEATEAGNEERRSNGWEEIEVAGWDKVPYYDTLTNNLTWATVVKQKGSTEESINHSVRLLGRKGVMHADLVADPKDMEVARAAFDSILANYEYLSGNKYAEWKPGDKVAKYGLTALIMGGAGVAAVKLGLFPKFWKLLISVFLAIKKLIIAVVAGIAAFFKKIFRKKEPTSETPPPETPPARGPSGAYKPATPGSPVAASQRQSSATPPRPLGTSQ